MAQKHSRNSTFNPNDYISDKPITAQERQILDKALSRTKINLFFNQNSAFVASLVACMDFVWDRSIPTACTNGVLLAWNPEFFLSLDKETRTTVLAHEAWHVAFEHPNRGLGKEHQVYNHAADYVINLMLKDHGYYMDGFPYLLDDQYRDMSTEDIYKKLYKDAKKGPLPASAMGSDFSSPGKKDPLQGKGSAKTRKMSPKDVAAKAKSNVIKAAAMAKMSKSAGKMPGEVAMILDDWLNPKLSWKQILANFFEANTDMNYSYRRPNRRYSGANDPIMPGMAGTEGLEHLIYYLDISGSISDADVLRFNSEVASIKRDFSPEKLTLVTFDTKIQDEYVFEKEDEFNDIKVVGRGGTDLEEVFKHAKENSPTAMIIFTDMWVGIPDVPPSVPLIWICVGNKNATVPYGRIIHIEND